MDFWHPIQFIRTFFILYKFIEFLPPSLNPLKLFSFISASNNVRYIPEHFFLAKAMLMPITLFV